MTHTAHIIGLVEYREGDGVNVVIPEGPCEVTETELDVTISWSDGDKRGVAALPVADFRRHVANGSIHVDVS